MFESRIEEGAKLLDREFGNRNDWVSAIDISTLDLGKEYSCVLGQTLGGFYNALTHLDMGMANSSEFGFFITDEEWDYVYDEIGNPYTVLTKEWVAFLTDKAIRDSWLMDERDAILADLPHTD